MDTWDETGATVKLEMSVQVEFAHQDLVYSELWEAVPGVNVGKTRLMSLDGLSGYYRLKISIKFLSMAKSRLELSRRVGK